MTLLKDIGISLLKGVIFAIIFAIIGAVFSFAKSWPMLKGAYIFVLVGGCITMIISVALLIGTPQMRKDMIREGDQHRNPRRGAEGIGPALMGMTMIIIGFWLEAMMHN
ncbi:ABC-type transport system involved in multi-copper enzyme maturation permease subunit [Anaerosolibacter carboniphilus]|uniref:ABC-type transport system involved in multi-copper enzyme maturation permease subunit n=1 Tax=Anaerosolibacter carboniphilus TaxID=1417629 RepID=A0A841KXI5_9FIRM|nr:hypothetical protein [Anaerosolibacter carboniphilus]MBB6218446.1 ABC-type transport system involved in multi-copper enzyme maturation permease subunit [Anaerosolibacter carboniphilus]